jgi:hypothetical protein
VHALRLLRSMVRSFRSRIGNFVESRALRCYRGCLWPKHAEGVPPVPWNPLLQSIPPTPCNPRILLLVDISGRVDKNTCLTYAQSS